MADSKTLLSQNEIDALIVFLKDHEGTQIGKVLDQGSIDKLVEIVQSYNNKGIILNKDSQVNMEDGIKAKITDATGKSIDVLAFEIILDLDSDLNVLLFCSDNAGNEKYPLFPETLSEKKFLTEGSNWGKAVAPRTLIELSKLFDIKCSPDALEKAKKLLAKVLYGDETKALPEYYLK